MGALLQDVVQRHGHGDTSVFLEYDFITPVDLNNA
jgi:hypothetical protein